MMRHSRPAVIAASAASSVGCAFCTSRHARLMASHHWSLKYGSNLTEPLTLRAMSLSLLSA